MKKKIFVFIFIFVIIIVGLIIPNEFYANLFNKDDDEITYVDSCLVYLLNEDEKLVGVNIPLEEKVEDEFNTKWNLITVDVPTNYTSPIYFSTQVIEKEIIDGVLKLNITEDFYVETSRSSLECLVYNFCINDVEKIELLVNNEKVTELNGVHFDYLSKDLGVNLTFETIDVLECIDITIIYEYENYTMPVTYYVKDTTELVTFLVVKSLSITEEVSDFDYNKEVSYELTETELVINISNYENFDNEVLNTLKSTINHYYDLDVIMVNGFEI